MLCFECSDCEGVRRSPEGRVCLSDVGSGEKTRGRLEVVAGSKNGRDVEYVWFPELCLLVARHVPLGHDSGSVGFVGWVELWRRWERGVTRRRGAGTGRSQCIRVVADQRRRFDRCVLSAECLWGRGEAQLRLMELDLSLNRGLVLSGAVLVVDLVEDARVEIGIGGVLGPVLTLKVDTLNWNLGVLAMLAHDGDLGFRQVLVVLNRATVRRGRGSSGPRWGMCRRRSSNRSRRRYWRGRRADGSSSGSSGRVGMTQFLLGHGERVDGENHLADLAQSRPFPGFERKESLEDMVGGMGNGEDVSKEVGVVDVCPERLVLSASLTPRVSPTSQVDEDDTERPDIIGLGVVAVETLKDASLALGREVERGSTERDQPRPASMT